MNGRGARVPWPWWLLRAGRPRHPRVGVLAVWVLVEWLEARRLHLRPVRPGGSLRYRLVRLDGGLEVELHLENRRLEALERGGATPWRLLGELRADLRVLAAKVAADPRVHGVRGETLLAEAGPLLGFELRPLPRRRFMSLDRFFAAGLVMLHNPRGWEAVQHYARRSPAELWLAREELLRLYPAPAAPAGSAVAAGRRPRMAASPSPTSAMSRSLTVR